MAGRQEPPGLARRLKSQEKQADIALKQPFPANDAPTKTFTPAYPKSLPLFFVHCKPRICKFFALLATLKERRENPRQIVPGGEEHKGQNQRKSDPESPLLSIGSKRPAAHDLNCVVQQVPSIEHGHGEQIDEPDAHGQHGGDSHQLVKAEFRRFAGNLRNCQWPAKLAGVFMAGGHALDEVQRSLDDAPGFRDTQLQRLDGALLFINQAAAPWARHAHESDSYLAAEAVFDL